MKMLGQTKTVHFSVDDTIWLFKGLKEEGYQSVFEQPVLKLFQELHRKYGIVVSFYCFMQQNWLRLADVPGMYHEELSENRDWCRFGFHAYHENIRYAAETPEKAAEDYLVVTEQLRRICGDSLDQFPRIHCSSAGEKTLFAMKRNGLCGILCAEPGTDQCYDLSVKEKQRIDKDGSYRNRKNGLIYFATDVRIEETTCISEALLRRKNNPHLEIFTHEWALDRDHVREKLELCCALVKQLGYQGSFQGEMRKRNG